MSRAEQPSVLGKLASNLNGNEILVLACYERDTECYIIVGGNSVNIQVYSIRTCLLVTEMEGHTDSVTCMVLDENILITGSDDHTIRLWNLRNFSPTGNIAAHEHAVQALVFMPESGVLLSCSQDREVVCWIYQKGRVLERFSKTEDLLCMEYIGEEGVLMLGTESGNILTHNVVHLINFQNDGDWPQLEDDYGDENDEQEEHKDQFGDDYDVL